MSRQPAAPIPLPDLHGNLLLAALPPDEHLRILPHLDTLTPRRGESLHRAGEPVRNVYFPDGGVFSVTRPLPDGTAVEAAAVGREGMLGIEACLCEDPVSVGQTLLQIPGGPLRALSVHAFRRELEGRGTLYTVVTRYAQVFLAAVIQSAACNALHDARSRCARWLLLAHDRMRHGEFRLSHETLATVLGASRPTVTLAALRLQDEGLITYSHGRVRVVNRPGLERAACLCYPMLRLPF